MGTLRVATYNIHKGVQGLGLARRLEIRNIGHAIEQLDADIVCLQEVRKVHRRLQHQLAHWPEQPQHEFLAPEGYEAVYETNAFTRHGEHGNALITRWPVVDRGHEDMSDHRFEQRGLLHAHVRVRRTLVHVIVVHLGLVAGSRSRQVGQLLRYVEREIPKRERVLIAGDFNDWGARLRPSLEAAGFRDLRPAADQRLLTYPSRLPLTQLDFIYARGMKARAAEVPRGRIWWRMSDHLPLIAEFEM